ncbi:50S ribosomal protein LX [Ignicoccus pacificus DSM 13166]|uniref:Large ribosomal subunit protein eL20 n=1 Tax=Ignicoccus pacificus DSM 13166 TaxID=940294 RepID=A0A977K9K6_9CREN|nr:50S ribosomal protein LX [Ignicoccus pacificus DSM 13166]
MSDVKFYKISGYMLISHDKNPRWQKFEIIRRGTKPEDVMERVYSELGSRHKLRRYHIKIENVTEVKEEEIEDIHYLQLAHLEAWEAYDADKVWRKYKKKVISNE